MFFLAHGGFQIQIEQTRRSLEEIGVEVDWLRWWDETQKADIIHYFGKPNAAIIEFAHAKKIRYVLTELLTGQGSWSFPRKLVNRAVLTCDQLLQGRIAKAFNWKSFRIADAVMVLTGEEKKLLKELYGAPAERVHVVPNGVEKEFFRQDHGREHRGDHLVCTATITPRKRVLELATMAVRAEVPLWFIGAPYAEDDPYFLRFVEFARTNPAFVCYQGPVNERTRLADIYGGARGFVLLSDRESQSLSALEAAAAGCPLLLSDLPWAKCTFGGSAKYCSLSLSPDRSAAILKEFYLSAPTLATPPKPKTWRDVAEQIKGVYDRVLTR